MRVLCVIFIILFIVKMKSCKTEVSFFFLKLCSQSENDDDDDDDDIVNDKDEC